MSTVTLQEAQLHLPDLVHRLAQGDEIVILENNQPIARLIGAAGSTKSAEPRKLGTLASSTFYMAPDFDAPLEDFKEYME